MDELWNVYLLIKESIAYRDCVIYRMLGRGDIKSRKLEQQVFHRLRQANQNKKVQLKELMKKLVELKMYSANLDEAKAQEIENFPAIQQSWESFDILFDDMAEELFNQKNELLEQRKFSSNFVDLVERQCLKISKNNSNNFEEYYDTILQRLQKTHEKFEMVVGAEYNEKLSLITDIVNHEIQQTTRGIKLGPLHTGVQISLLRMKLYD